MKSKPLIFTGESVPRILRGWKTQTRRVVNLDKLRVRLPGRVSSEEILHLAGLGRSAEAGAYRARLNPHGAVSLIEPDLGLRPGEFHFACPYAEGTTTLVKVAITSTTSRSYWHIEPAAGSRLWVREASIIAPPRFSDDDRLHQHVVDPAGHPRLIQYLATAPDTEGAENFKLRTTPAVRMPRWASRLTLEVLSVRLERLQAITEADAKAEGVEPRPGWRPDIDSVYGGEDSYRRTFERGWDGINGRRKGASWKDNPFVWAITFRLVANSSAEVARAM